MSDIVRTVLGFLLVLATSVWVGGVVTVLLVRRVVDDQLDRGQAVAFFRTFGRLFGAVAGAALVVAILTGGALLTDHGWDAPAVVAAALAVAVVVTTAIGVRQARAMTVLRARALAPSAEPGLPDAVRSGARRAAVLRTTIGLLSVALLALGCGIAA